ncbi:unannotated protein [freshwater metagenome]|jgi:hypothetical protein|uniref:Unannotated protein n=1 Tax=freshwater metagenome TaxID=449393 RepID=A0A6J7IW05_9ZZZZ
MWLGAQFLAAFGASEDVGHGDGGGHDGAGLVGVAQAR